jgi:hypothetical protein
VSTDRSTEEVFRDHLALRSRGEVEQDIERNYDPDVTLIRGGTVYRGQDGVRECARQLRQDIGDAKATYKTARVEGDVAFLEWAIHDNGVVVEDGVDTFVIRNGRIVTNTVHYTVQAGNIALALRTRSLESSVRGVIPRASTIPKQRNTLSAWSSGRSPRTKLQPAMNTFASWVCAPASKSSKSAAGAEPSRGRSPNASRQTAR